MILRDDFFLMFLNNSLWYFVYFIGKCKYFKIKWYKEKYISVLVFYCKFLGGKKEKEWKKKFLMFLISRKFYVMVDFNNL